MCVTYLQNYQLKKISWKMSQREKRQKKRPKHLNEYVLGTNEHSKPKIAKLDTNEGPNVGALVDRGTPNEGVGNFSKPETISSGMI